VKLIKKQEITFLNEDWVQIHTREALDMGDGTERRFDDKEPEAKIYVNSAEGREKIVDELPEIMSSAILVMWGDEPSAEDYEETEKEE